MAFLQNLKKLLGLNKEESTTLQDEVDSLNSLIVKSFRNCNTAEGVKPEDVLVHTNKIKEIIVSLYENGHLHINKQTVDYILGNISAQEKTIRSFYAGYVMGDIQIYTSQVGASLSEILKDIATLIR